MSRRDRPDEPRLRGPLAPVELAEAAILGDLSLALCVLGYLLPLGVVLLVMGVAPMAALAQRRRPRAVLAATLSASAVAFLIAGSGLAGNTVACGVLGFAIGRGVRNQWGRWRSIGITTVVAWPVWVATTVATLALLPDFRRLTLRQIENGWKTQAKTWRWLGRNVWSGFDGVARHGDHGVRWVLDHWWLSIPIVQLPIVVFAAWASHAVARPALSRLARAAGPVRPATRASAGSDADLPPGPVPVALHNVRHRWPGGEADALAGIDVTIPARGFVAVVGDNGSGKSTLSRILAGMPPTSGQVERPGGAGPGREGGAGQVFQRPECQVLGVRVADDLVWGLPAGTELDAADSSGLLDAVGLGGMDERETATLSGGELQRLAVASALARRPALLLSDESTAMVDALGRREVAALLRRLPAERGITVVHVTHHPEETEGADLVLRLDRGRVVPPAPIPAVDPVEGLPVHTPTHAFPPPGDVLIDLKGVGHVYDRRSPWAHRALTGVDLQVRAGEGLLVAGHNGSGKTTLAWVMAGLTEPSEGTATIESKPAHLQVGRVGLALQHARLQLQRPTVRADIKAASGGHADDDEIDRVLGLVGLDPDEFGPRRIDALSGGQQRRIALAGLLARKPGVLVLDEPFAGLDVPSRAVLAEVLAGLRIDAGVALVVVSHDLDGVAGITDRIVVLDRGTVAREVPVADLDGHDPDTLVDLLRPAADVPGLP